MKQIIALIIICIYSISSWAQAYPYKLTGFLGVKGGESFTYELHLKDSTNNLLTGYAYTYLTKGKDVKATITAQIDRAQKKLIIKEGNILENNGFTSKAVICLLNAELIYSEQEEGLNGKLFTKTAGSGALPCSDGSISFINKYQIQQLFDGINIQETTPTVAAVEPIQKPTPQVKPDTRIQDSIRIAQYQAQLKALPPKPVSITEGKDKTYDWKSDKVIMEIWDGNNEDGDQVDIELNGKVILAGYVLKNKKHKITLDISNNELSFITIKALNEGGDPPNTANISITDGTETYYIIAHNHTDKKASIKIKRQLQIP